MDDSYTLLYFQLFFLNFSSVSFSVLYWFRQ